MGVCCIVDVVGSENGGARAFLRMIAFRVAGRVSLGEAFDGAWWRLRVICRRVWRMRSVAMVRRIESEEKIRVNERRDDDGRLCLNAPFLSAPLRRIWDAGFSFYLSPDPLLPALSYLRTSYNPPPAGSGEERVS